ncbi:hypothetical protein ACI7RC_11190 [Brevibacillus sp. B_LB10_24]|uniref:hypothetical protein n=1 Tax=Brevibacillus sp. B_LB10_24 TaxID=3380645 RepID=UPI0038BA67AF
MVLSDQCDTVPLVKSVRVTLSHNDEQPGRAARSGKSRAKQKSQGHSAAFHHHLIMDEQVIPLYLNDCVLSIYFLLFENKFSGLSIYTPSLSAPSPWHIHFSTVTRQSGWMIPPDGGASSLLSNKSILNVLGSTYPAMPFLADSTSATNFRDCASIAL